MTLELEAVDCCICGAEEAEPVAVGEDFEYRTSDDIFLAVRCGACSLIYLDPRPTIAELTRIYPDSYHALDFSPERFGLVHRVRRRLEARRLLQACGDLAPGARVLDVGCGDGFHLDLLRQYGPESWGLEGVDLDTRAVERVRQRGLVAHLGGVEDLDLDVDAYDMVVMIQTIEHVAHPPAVLGAVRRILRPGARLLVVTDNTASIDRRLFRGRAWGGYHFPRHWNLFDECSMLALAAKAGLEVESLGTMVSPVNWVYSLRNTLDDLGAPRWAVEQFSLSTPASLGLFTVVDGLAAAVGRGALLRVVLRKPT